MMIEQPRLVCHGPFDLAGFINGQVVPEVGSATGVYLWCPRLRENTYKVWYVGKAAGKYGFAGRHYQYRTFKHHLRLDLDAYERGEWRKVESSESDREFWDRLYGRTHLFLIPTEAESAAAAESAVIRHLGKEPDWRAFMWNYWMHKRSGGAASTHHYPCSIDCAEDIRGLPKRLKPFRLLVPGWKRLRGYVSACV